MRIAVFLVGLMLILVGAFAATDFLNVYNDTNYNAIVNISGMGDTVYVRVINFGVAGANYNVSVTSDDDATGINVLLTMDGANVYKGNFQIADNSLDQTRINASSPLANVSVFADLDEDDDNSTVTFMVDNTAPVVHSITINKTVGAAGQNIKISANVSDALVGISNVSILFGGVALTTTNNSGIYEAVFTVVAPEGTYTINVTTNDTVGNFGSSTVNWDIDNTAPAGSIIYPLNESYVDDASPNICLNVTDPNDVDVNSINMIAYDGTNTFTPGTTSVINNGYRVCIDLSTAIPSVTEDDGVHMDVTVNATDSVSVNNKLTNFYWWFVVDRNAPNSLIVHSPVNNSVNMTWLNFTVTDSASQRLNCSMIVNGTETSIGMVDNNTMNSTDISGWAEGYYLLAMKCDDLAGHSLTNQTFYFTKDTSAPTLAYLMNDTYINSAQNTLIEMNVTDFSGVANVSVSVGDSVINVTDNGGGSYSAIFTPNVLPDGNYSVYVNRTDGIGNQANTTIGNITIDNVVPVITVYEPAGWYNDSVNVNYNMTVLENGVLYDDGNYSGQSLISCNWGVDEAGAPTPMGGLFGTFAHKDNGSHNVTYNCTDRADNSDQKVATYLVNDTIVPTLNITLPLNITYNDSSVLLQFEVNEQGSCNYSINASVTTQLIVNYSHQKPATLLYWRNITLNLANGAYNATVVCTDTGNNNVTDTEWFSVNDIDLDNDGFNNTVDCNDNNAAIFPGAVELNNGVDDDCDGTVDEGFGGNNPPGGSNPPSSPPIDTAKNDDPPGLDEPPIDLPTATPTPEPQGGGGQYDGEVKVEPECGLDGCHVDSTKKKGGGGQYITGLLFQEGSFIMGLAGLLAVLSAWILWSASKTRAKRKWYEKE